MGNSISSLPVPIERALYLSAQVTQDSMVNLTKKIIEINEDDKRLKKFYKAFGFKYKPAPIKIYIDSYGGMVYQCFGLLGAMRVSKTPIHTIVTGCAMSCGFLISISGHKRFAYEKATLLYHQISSGMHGKAKELEEELVEAKRLQKMIEDHVTEFTKIPKKRLEQSYKEKEDWFISSEEALTLSCIDKIITREN
jgi:ATP-dependent Clp protease protease subunit